MTDDRPQYESDVVLRGGSTLHLRAIRPDDLEALKDFHTRLSPESLHFRFFGTVRWDPDAAARLTQTDDRIGVVLVGESSGRIDAVALYMRDPKEPERAEVAFTIADAVQGQGIGTRMLERLSEIAAEHHIRWFDAYVMQGNDRMMRMFLDSGFEVRQRLEEGIIHVTLSLERTVAFETQAAHRAQLAATASMKAFFEPKTVAVVGASRTRGKVGAEIYANILKAGFSGRVIPVNARASSIDGAQAYAKVTDVPGTVDLAVIAVPEAQVARVVDDCIAKGVTALVIITAGFGETGPAGREAERALLERVRSAGIRMIGPNCMGLINTDPAVRLDATFAPTLPLEGRVAFLSQSGALGLTILDYTRRLGLGISTFVSVGNKADVSSNDLIQYWAEDPRTDVILLYLESFGNPRKFSQIARRIGREKPIVAVKAGRSSAGARAASSHTGALATGDAIVDALFRQSGVIRTRTLEELFDVATLLAHQPVPKGPRIAILTNGGGPGILAADACEGQGLELPPLSDETVAGLRQFLPQAASVANPVDMLATASADDYGRSMRLLLADDRIDSLLVIFIPPLVIDAEAAAAAIVASAAAAGDKTVVTSFMSAQGAPSILSPIPSYMFPEAAASALGHAAAYGAWRRRPAGTRPHFGDIRGADVRVVIDAALIRGGGWLTPIEAQHVLEAIGIPIAPARPAASEAEALTAAQQIGFPIALKAVGAEIVHKTEVGGVTLGLMDEHALRTAYREMQSRLGSRLTGVLVQSMVPGGVEMLIGGLQDPTFGPLVVCGTGGVLVDLLADSVFRLHPLTDLDAADMVSSMKGAALLRGYRGAPPADENALRDALLRVSELIELCPEISELDINPIKVLEKGVRAIDVRMRIDPLQPPLRSRRIAY